MIIYVNTLGREKNENIRNTNMPESVFMEGLLVKMIRIRYNLMIKTFIIQENLKT